MLALSLPVAVLALSTAAISVPQHQAQLASMAGAEPAAQRMVSAPPPQQGGFVILSQASTAAGTEILRSQDGLFYVTAVVNGAPVRFIVDTGATVVVLTPDDARRVGIAVDATDFTGKANTANGNAAMARVKLSEVVVGATRKEAVEAAVVGQGLHVSLLGQSLLSRLSSVTIQADRMVLN